MCGLDYITTSDPLRVTAEVKHNPTSTIVCKAQGEWNGTLEFTYSSGETKVIDTAKLAVTRKRLRTVERQGRTESRSDTPGRRTPPHTPGWPTHPTLTFFFFLQAFVAACDQGPEGRKHRRGHGAQTPTGGAAAGRGEAESGRQQTLDAQVLHERGKTSKKTNKTSLYS